MKLIFPPRLKAGDEIRIIAPARSLALLSKEIATDAQQRLESLGFKISYGKHVNEKDDFISSSVDSRIRDLHDAFKDKNVSLILPVIGGFNSNQLLRYLNYNLIKNNPKILGGYSDIAALQNAIFTKTDLVTYSTPTFSTFAMKEGLDYAIESFKQCLTTSTPYEIKPSKQWSNDAWWKDQTNRIFEENTGPYVINSGKAEGTLIGSSLSTFNLLQGTEYMPSLKDRILFIEEDEESKPVNFDRDLQSLIHQTGFKGVKGIVIGRFEKASKMTPILLAQIIKNKKELVSIPVIADVDFGHTYPMITFPIGGHISLDASKNIPMLQMLKH